MATLEPKPQVRFATFDDGIEEMLVDLVNRAFSSIEEGLVLPDKQDGLVHRLTVANTKDLIKKKELLILDGSPMALSSINNNNNESPLKIQPQFLLGCCTVRKVNEQVGEWGCLAVHRDHQGRGYGRRLLLAAEAYLVDILQCQELECTFLGPTNISLYSEHKRRIVHWYQHKHKYSAVPEASTLYKAGDEFGELSNVFFAADATLRVFRKKATTWVRRGCKEKDEPFIEDLVSMVNDVYRKGEKGILEDSPDVPLRRLSAETARKLIHNFFILWEATTDGRKVIGCVKFDEGNAGIGEWGCLAVHADRQGMGFATRLVRVVEDHLQRNCEAWKIQLVAPTDWTHNHKERLRVWYERGLRYIRDPETVTHFSKGDRIGSFLVFATNATFTDFLSSPVAMQRRQYHI